MKTLNISTGLTLPLDTVTSTLIVYGGKGMGKTNLLAVLAEELTAAGQRFSIIDPMGVLWGLRHSADGKGPGIELLILGGRYGDIPIQPAAGAVVADLVVDEDANVLIDISSKPDGKTWSRGERIKFVTNYFVRLYERQGEHRRPIMQILDEAARFAPQQIRAGDKEIALCVGAIEQAVEEGRNFGIGVCLSAQRSARMNKSVSELADCMIAFRTIGPNSIASILDWFGEHVEKDRWKGYIEKLRTLPRGTALVVSPGWLEFEGQATMRLRHTFDSSATPTQGQRMRSIAAGAKPDLTKYIQRMAETIEKAKADDPEELKQQVAALRQENANLKRTLPPSNEAVTRIAQLERELAQPVPIPKAALDAIHADARQTYAAELARRLAIPEIRTVAADLLQLANDAMTTLSAEIDKPPVPKPPVALHRSAPPPAASPSPAPTRTPSRKPEPPAISPVISSPATTNSHTALKTVHRKILTVLAQFPQGRDMIQLLILTQYRPSGTVDTAIAELKRWNLIEGSSARFTITSAGIVALGPFQALPTGKALFDYWLDKLPTTEGKILKALEGHGTLTMPELLNTTGYRPSGTVDSAIAKLKRLELITGTSYGLTLSSAFSQGT